MDASDTKLPMCVDGTIEATKTFASISNTPLASPNIIHNRNTNVLAWGTKYIIVILDANINTEIPNLEKLDIFFTRDTKNTSKAPHVEASDIRIMAKNMLVTSIRQSTVNKYTARDE